MTVQKTVWTLGDVYANIYLQDQNGNLVGTTQTPTPTAPFTVAPTVDYCFLESVTIKASTPIVRRAITGRDRRKLVGPAGMYDEISFEIEHMLFKKDDEFNLSIFNPRQFLMFYFLLYKLEYSSSGSDKNDPFRVNFCKAQSFNITGRMPEAIIANASFLGESMQ